jgi:thiamine biosynthesis lipoprotein
LCALWDRVTTVPGKELIEAALKFTGWQRLTWEGSRLRLPPGMRLDLGGIVKEYAADRAALLLKAAAYSSGYIDLGGDLHVLGPHPDGSPWHIGIRHPRSPGAMATVAVPRGGLATSGDYERCSMIDGQRYGHIIDALTGWPACGLASVSVIAPSCLLAGALSTLAMVQETAQGLEILSNSGLAWLAHDGSFPFREKLAA